MARDNNLVSFDRVPVNAKFSINGDTYKKQSSRTAWMDYAGKWFYMPMDARCIVTHTVSVEIMRSEAQQ